MAQRRFANKSGSMNQDQAPDKGALDTVQGYEEWVEFASCLGLPTEYWFPTLAAKETGYVPPAQPDPQNPADLTEWRRWRNDEGRDGRVIDSSWEGWLGWRAKEEARDRAYIANAAKKICSNCYVQMECLEFALKNGETAGMWGGISSGARRVLHASWNRLHGVTQHHRQLGERMSSVRKPHKRVQCDCGKVIGINVLVLHQRACGYERYEEIEGEDHGEISGS